MGFRLMEDMVVASYVFHWQEKRFSPSEVSEVRKDMRRASRGEGGGGLLARFFSRQRDDFVRVRRRHNPSRTRTLAEHDFVRVRRRQQPAHNPSRTRTPNRKPKPEPSPGSNPNPHPHPHPHLHPVSGD